MVIKPCIEPILLLTEEALLRRLFFHHQKREEVKANVQKGWSGFRGEKSLIYHLEFLPEKEYFIFHDLRLVIGKRSFQIDVLVLTPFAAFIIESKNLSGHLIYDQHVKRLIRIYQNQEESFPDPLMQAKRQQILFKRWLEAHKVKDYPVEYLVAIGNAATSLKTNGPLEVFRKILYAEQIPDRIQELNPSHKDRIFSPNLLQKICALLIQSHTPPTIQILNKYEISRSELINGVQCPFCSGFPMIRTKSNWYCTPCQKFSPDAHLQAIMDFLLIHGTMTNQQARKFLHLTSTNTCSRLLEKMQLFCSGKRKYKIYSLPDSQNAYRIIGREFK